MNRRAPRVKRNRALARDLIHSLVPKTSATPEARSKKGHFWRPLPRKFRRRKLNYRLIAREGNAAIYEQTWSGCHNPSVCYEVIRIRRREGFAIDGRFVEPAEIYPNSEAWGVDGFTLTDKDAAFAKLMVRDNSVGNIRRRNRSLVQKIGEGSPFRSPTSRTPLDG